METFLWAVICIFGIAALIDRVMTEDAVRAWQRSSMDLRDRLLVLDITEATRIANVWFRGLFDAIYGERFWSFRRLVRSFISSVLALTVITLLLGWETTLFETLDFERTGYFFFGQLVGLLVMILILNTGGDYFSLQETRWVLGRCAEAGLIKLLGWVVFDLVATTTIFLLGVTLIAFIIGTIINIVNPSAPVQLLDELPVHWYWSLKRNGGLPFFLSTFFTSAFWFLFVFNALLVRALRQSSRSLRIVLEAIGESAAPARTTAGILTLIIFAGYGIVAGVGYFVG